MTAADDVNRAKEQGPDPALRSPATKPPVPKVGLLLVNLGTPESAELKDVFPYLNEFLMDRRVLTMPAIIRWMLVNLVILPTRPQHSADAYARIWSEQGSPLRVAHEALSEAVQNAFANDRNVVVEHAMRYGKPSIRSKIASMIEDGMEQLVVFPLYPQYASSTTGTVLEEVMDSIRGEWNIPSFCTVPAFYDDKYFVDAVIAAGKEAHHAFDADHVLFSFHGLPEDHLHNSDPSKSHCLSADDPASMACCEKIGAHNRFCYRAQCLHTARAIASALSLGDDEWTLSFQSRLGRAEWIKPYTDSTVKELARAGKKRLAVYCPAFVADCLETLEEIGMEAKDTFVEAGGEDLRLIPCVNSHSTWVQGVVQLAKKSSAWL
ncbi:MAG: ferrochelatase [Deltaproteobacteria bacterium]|nr:ferrochelatase [Deltaproteobacteria bacterium]